MDVVFLDSCILIDLIKGVEGIREVVEQIEKPCINFIVEMELLQGARDKRELLRIEKGLNLFNRLAFHDKIAELSTSLLRDYSLSHSLQIADAVIAATCLVYSIPLFTYNKKDFRFIPELELYDVSITQPIE